MAKDIYLVTRRDDDSKVAFEQEADILASLQITYSAIDHTIERPDRNTYTVKISNEDVINTDVFDVQRVTLMEAPDHL